MSRYFNREDGKKYKRYTLDSSQINAVFNHGKSIVDLPFVVASLKEYLDNGTRDAGRVIKEAVTVARSDGTWLYVADERRRINSKGVTVLGKISPERKNDVADLIERFYQREAEYYIKIESLLRDNYYLCEIMDKCKKLSSDEASRSIRDICSKQIQAIEQAKQEERVSFDAFKEAFEKELSECFLSKDPIQVQKTDTPTNNKPLCKKL